MTALDRPTSDDEWTATLAHTCIFATRVYYCCTACCTGRWRLWLTNCSEFWFSIHLHVLSWLHRNMIKA